MRRIKTLKGVNPDINNINNSNNSSNSSNNINNSSNSNNNSNNNSSNNSSNNSNNNGRKEKKVVRNRNKGNTDNISSNDKDNDDKEREKEGERGSEDLVELVEAFISDKKEGLDYVKNYRDFIGISGKSQLDLLYQKFMNQQKQQLALKHLGFLENKMIDDYNLMNTYFDRIYVLNLDRRPDRWLAMKKSLDKLGIYNYERFSATDGSLSPHYHEWKHYSRMPLTRHELIKYKRKAIGSAGSWAILKASYRMLRDAKERGFKRILVLQDDLLFHKRFLEEFAKVPTYIKEDWKLLYLGATQHNWQRVLKSKNFYYPAGTADGAFAVGIDCSIFDELMKEIIKFNMPFDSGPLRTLQERYLYNCYVLDPNLIIADIRDSDLRHSRDLMTFGKRFRWDVDLYDIDNL